MATSRAPRLQVVESPFPPIRHCRLTPPAGDGRGDHCHPRSGAGGQLLVGGVITSETPVSKAVARGAPVLCHLWVEAGSGGHFTGTHACPSWQGGPCGVLAAVQGCVLQKLLFEGDSRADCAR